MPRLVRLSGPIQLALDVVVHDAVGLLARLAVKTSRDATGVLDTLVLPGRRELAARSASVALERTLGRCSSGLGGLEVGARGLRLILTEPVV